MRYRFIEINFDEGWAAPAVVVEIARESLLLQSLDKLVDMPGKTLEELTPEDFPAWKREVRLGVILDAPNPDSRQFVQHFVQMMAERCGELQAT
ncbi:MAG: hypothetical protein ACOX9B_12535 [Candidatus Xenobium sp.]|jgi:hypothetical protein|nr:hypothetical protein [Burkholderiales bacterium]